MFSFPILSSLLAILLIQISRFPHESKHVRDSGPCFSIHIDWRPAMSFQPATCRTDCSFAAVSRAGAPPGLRAVLLDHVQRMTSNRPRYRSAASV